LFLSGRTQTVFAEQSHVHEESNHPTQTTSIHKFVDTRRKYLTDGCNRPAQWGALWPVPTVKHYWSDRIEDV